MRCSHHPHPHAHLPTTPHPRSAASISCLELLQSPVTSVLTGSHLAASGILFTFRSNPIPHLLRAEALLHFRVEGKILARTYRVPKGSARLISQQPFPSPLQASRPICTAATWLCILCSLCPPSASPPTAVRLPTDRRTADPHTCKSLLKRHFPVSPPLTTSRSELCHSLSSVPSIGYMFPQYTYQFQTLYLFLFTSSP